MTTHTPQALQAAWLAMRHRPAFRHWPQDFDQVMADSVRARLVGLEATGNAHRRSPCKPDTVPAVRPSLPRWPNTAGRTPTVQPNLFDHKRAAAGERADD